MHQASEGQHLVSNDLFTSKLAAPDRMDRRSILLKGPSGAGKSHQLISLVEGGWKGLYVCLDEHGGTVKHLFAPEYKQEHEHAPDWFMLQQVDVPLMPSEKKPDKQDFMVVMDALRTPNHPYDFIFFDSLMAFGDALEHYLKYVAKLGGYDLWGMYAEKMKMMLKLLTSLTGPQNPRPVHVIATWGVEVGKDWEGKRSIQPITSGRVIGPRIPYYFDDVYYLEKGVDPEGKTQYVLNTTGTHEFDAKVSAYGAVLPERIASPNLYKILERLKSA